MIAEEKQILEETCNKFSIKKVHEFSDDYKYDKNSCKICKCYLYLWYLKSEKSNHIYCLKHAEDCG